MNIEISIDSRRETDKSPGERSMNILIVGNFSGAGQAGAGEGRQGPIRNMFNMQDFDVDAAIAALRPALDLAEDQAGDADRLTFARLDDFHPDRLFARHPAFTDISQLKQALGDPAKRAAAAVLARSLLGDDAAPAPAVHTAGVAAEAAPAEAGDDLLSRLLGKPTGGTSTVRDSVQRMLEEAAGDDIVPDQDPEYGRLAEGLDALCAEAMRDLLQKDGFRDLECAWRAVQWLVEQVEIDEDSSLWLVDVGTAGVAEWSAALPRAVLERAGGADLIVALASFSDDEASLAELRQLAAAAAELRTSALAAADSSLAGLDDRFSARPVADGSDFAASTSAPWQALRAEPHARHVGLAFPRILSRQPYGERSDPVDAFDFEELGSAPAHDAFCWGNAAIALAAMYLKDELSVSDLPLVTYDDGGGQAIKPPSEVYLTDSASRQCLQRGIVPLCAQRGHTDVRVPRLQSIADPPGAL